MTEEDNYEKILVRYFSNVLEETTVETLWAKVVDRKKGFYKIDNIPFYGPNFSSEDLVLAEYDEHEERLTFKKVIEYSGNSTIQIIILDEKIDIKSLRKEFEILGCYSEASNNKYFVMEIPFNTNYHPIYNRLKELQLNQIIDFSEPSISKKHFDEK